MTSPLAGYALLKASFDKKITNAIDLLVPLAKRALHGWRDDYIDPDKLQQKIFEIWGISIPETVIRYLLPKLAKEEFVVFNVPNKRYKPNTVKTNDKAIIQQERESRKKYENLIQSLRVTILRESSYDFEPEEVLEKWLDTSAISFLGGAAVAANAGAPDNEINRIIAITLGLLSD